MTTRSIITGISLVLILLIGAFGAYFLINSLQENRGDFDAGRALADVEHQLNLGPRTPGSPGHAAVIEWIQIELTEAGWGVEGQES